MSQLVHVSPAQKGGLALKNTKAKLEAVRWKHTGDFGQVSKTSFEHSPLCYCDRWASDVSRKERDVGIGLEGPVISLYSPSINLYKYPEPYFP